MNAIVLKTSSTVVPSDLLNYYPVFTLDNNFINYRETDPKLANLLEANSPDKLILLIPEQNSDAWLASIIASLMRLNRLDILILPIYSISTVASVIYDLAPIDIANYNLAGLEELKQYAEITLIRDEYAYVIVGEAKQLPLKLKSKQFTKGESYVDEQRLFTGKMKPIEIKCSPQIHGIEALQIKKLIRAKKLTGRAIQTGSTGMHISRDGILDEKIRPKSTFYAYHLPWKLLKFPCS